MLLCPSVVVSLRSLIISQSQYKSLLISDRTTVDEVIQLLLNCYNSKERVEQFSLYEVCRSQEYQRKLHPDDCPLHVQHCWTSPNEFHFLIRRNLDFRPRTKVRNVQSSDFFFFSLTGVGFGLFNDAMNWKVYTAAVVVENEDGALVE